MFTGRLGRDKIEFVPEPIPAKSAVRFGKVRIDLQCSGYCLHRLLIMLALADISVSDNITMRQSLGSPGSGVIRIESDGAIKIFEGFEQVLCTALFAQIHGCQIKPISFFTVGSSAYKRRGGIGSKTCNQPVTDVVGDRVLGGKQTSRVSGTRKSAFDLSGRYVNDLRRHPYLSVRDLVSRIH